MGLSQVILYISVLYIFLNFISYTSKQGIKIFEMLTWGMAEKKLENIAL